MISLNVEEYCMNCPNFEADVDKTSWSTGEVYTKIRCTHSRQCYEIKKYLERQSQCEKVLNSVKNEEGPIKCEKTCSSCCLHSSYCELKCNTDKCEMTEYDSDGNQPCRCINVTHGEHCPYYKSAK
jgi:hypothetical protein